MSIVTGFSGPGEGRWYELLDEMQRNSCYLSKNCVEGLFIPSEEE